jgi:hypothetical protein
MQPVVVTKSWFKRQDLELEIKIRAVWNLFILPPPPPILIPGPTSVRLSTLKKTNRRGEVGREEEKNVKRRMKRRG